MINQASSLLLGVFVIIAVFIGVYRGLHWRGKQAAMLVALAVIGVYVPIAIVYWPGGDVFAMHIAIYLVSVYILGIITMSRDARFADGAETGRWFHWGPAAIVIFFACIIAVDSVLMVVAQQGIGSGLAKLILPEADSGKGEVSSFFPGVVKHNFQQKEDQYNEYRERLLEQKKRGWSVHKGWIGTAVAGKPAKFRVEVSDHQQKLVQGAQVTGHFMRSSDSRLDRLFTMKEVSPGIYETQVSLPVSGRWDLVLSILKDGQLHEVTAVTTIGNSDN